MKIVILDAYTENPGDLSWADFSGLGELTVYDRTAPEDIVDRIGNAEIVLTNKTPITAETLEACPGIKYIGVLATGYNVVNISACRERGIPVTNTPNYGAAGVAQYAMALLLEICGHVGHHNEAVHSGRWESCSDFCFWDRPIIELAGKTMGIIGLGTIGMHMARMANAMGMRVIAHSRSEREEGKTLARYVSLDELFEESDIISLHCPLFPETAEIINKSNIEKMKKGVIIINNGRGGLVNEEDLAEALRSGKVAAAGLDVVSTEPIKGDNPLLKAPNCIITPHISWAARESRQRLMDIALANLKAYIRGESQNVVN